METKSHTNQQKKQGTVLENFPLALAKTEQNSAQCLKDQC